MRIRWRSRSLLLKAPFTIARGTITHAESIFVELEHAGVLGLGEVVPTARYAETPQSVAAQFEQLTTLEGHPLELATTLANLTPAARCALDTAQYDWLGKSLAVPLWRYFGVDRLAAPQSSYTIGLAPIPEMLKKLAAMADYPIIKLKLGSPVDLEIVAAIRAVYTGTLRLDANEAWTVDEALRMLHELEKYDIEFCEQPIAAGNLAQLRYLRERVRIPLIADEDAHTSRDVLALRDCVDGVNLKLVKSGGIAGGLEFIRTARAAGLQVMIGCMVESSLLATAAAQLSPLVDYADIDGPLLLQEDPYVGVTYEAGKLILPDRPGIGAIERQGTATR